MRRAFCVVASALLLASCGKKAADQPTEAAAAPNQRRIDTAIAKSGLPGASAVGRAMGAADAASARAAQQDSLAGQLR